MQPKSESKTSILYQNEIIEEPKNVKFVEEEEKIIKEEKKTENNEEKKNEEIEEILLEIQNKHEKREKEIEKNSEAKLPKENSIQLLKVEVNKNSNESEGTDSQIKNNVFSFFKKEKKVKEKMQKDSVDETSVSRKELMRLITKKNLKRKNVEQYLEKQLIENEKERQEDLKKTNKKKYLQAVTFGIIIKVGGVFWQSIMSIFSCAVYVVNTYYPPQLHDQTVFEVLELFFVVQFTIDYLIGFALSKNKIKYFLHYLSIIDLITIFPVIALYAAPSYKNNDPADLDSLGKFLNVIKVIRVFRILRLYRIFNLDRNDSPMSEVTEIRRKIIMICSTVLSMIFIAAGVIQSFQEMRIFNFKLFTSDQVLSFDLSLYYMVVTCTTVGYGDISPSPDSWFAKGLIGLFIMFMIILISKQTSELNTLIQFDSQYRYGYKSSSKHIILIGNITANNLSKFLMEFYHPDHEMNETVKIFIIQETPPSKEIKSIIENPKYEDLLGYMIGNIFKEGILKLAKAEGTKVFIMNDQFVVDSKKDDTFALLASKALREFDHSLKIYVQLYDPDYLLHSWADWDVAMSTQSFKMGIIAANVFERGFGTLISNLIVSSSCSNIKDRNSLPLWTLEYMNGLGQEIYIIKFENDINGDYKNQNFRNVVRKIYRERGVLLVGLRHLNLKESTNFNFYEVLINPHDFIIQESDEGIIFASNPDEANSIFETNSTPQDPNTIEINSTVVGAIISDLPFEDTYLESEGELTKDYYRMWEVDMQDVLRNHIVVFGLFEHFAALCPYLNNYTNQYICYISDKPPGEFWGKLVREFPNVKYFECSLTNIEELSRTGIKDAFHVILLTWLVTDSNIQDSGILPLARIMEENFKNVPFTLELIDESNMKYLNNRPDKTLEKMPHFYWPRYAASNVFFSSIMDYIMAQSFHNESIVEIIGKTILGQKYNPNISGIDEHSKVRTIKIPDSLPQFISYLHIFEFLITRSEPVLPIALVRFSGSYDNELPFVVANPKPNSPIMNGDIILVLGPDDSIEDKKMKEENFGLKNQKSDVAKTLGNIGALEEIIDIANKMLKEDDQLNIENQEMAKLVEEELNLTTKERKEILQQNEILRSALNEYYHLKTQFLMKKNGSTLLLPNT